ncbi:DUF805 domain-containing protein [Asticcacaulis solisilvae]|uniref:DUF805 domain-containing protein n=1 Tax=Asticcacaulis solisilvae TaxID=1217274 RepID=UPI003FD7C5B1
MTFPQAIQSCLKNYAKFEGRATRSEYWWFFLFYLLALIVPSFVGAILQSQIVSAILGLFMLVAFFGLILPSLAVSIRRLHDTNRSGWWLLLGALPLGGFVVLVFHCLESTPGPNKYGPTDNTKAIADAFS